MPVHIAWDDSAETMLLMDVIAPWTWDEYLNAASKGRDMASEKLYTVHLIVDFTLVGTLPRGYLLGFQRAAQYIPPNGGLIIMIGVTGVLKRVGNVMGVLLPQHLWRVRHLNSLDEARQKIAEYRSRP